MVMAFCFLLTDLDLDPFIYFRCFSKDNKLCDSREASLTYAYLSCWLHRKFIGIHVFCWSRSWNFYSYMYPCLVHVILFHLTSYVLSPVKPHWHMHMCPVDFTKYSYEYMFSTNNNHGIPVHICIHICDLILLTAYTVSPMKPHSNMHMCPVGFIKNSYEYMSSDDHIHQIHVHICTHAWYMWSYFPWLSMYIYTFLLITSMNLSLFIHIDA